MVPYSVMAATATASMLCDVPSTCHLISQSLVRDELNVDSIGKKA